MAYKDKEKERAYHKAYRKANRQKVNAWVKAWRKANPEKVKAANKAYREAHPKETKARNKAYREFHPEKKRESERKRRALKHQTRTEAINDKMVFLRDGWICQICHKKVDKKLKYPNPMCATLDHIVPLNEGGTDMYNNVHLAHFVCNASKQDNILPQGEQLRMF